MYGMSEPRSYTGGCQCGRVRYQAQIDLEQPVLSCNCSMCGRAGTLLTFVPARQFTLVAGEEDLTDYQFNAKHIHHLFCKVCGIKSFARGAGKDGPVVAVNARCLDEVDPTALKIVPHDGKSA
jgi:hypothetical protein